MAKEGPDKKPKRVQRTLDVPGREPITDSRFTGELPGQSLEIKRSDAPAPAVVKNLTRGLGDRVDDVLGK